MRKLRDDALRRGYDALRTRKPTLMKAPPIAVPAFVYWRPDQSMIWARTRQEAYRRPQDDAAMIKLLDDCYVAVARTPELEPGIRTDWQDEIVKLHARGGSLGVIRDAVQARGLQIDDDGVQAVLGPAGHMFGDGDPSAAALTDDEVEALNAEPGRSLPEKVRPQKRRPSHPRYGQRITFWPSISSFCKYKRAKPWTWSTEAAPGGSPYDPECYFSRPPLVGRVLGTALSEERGRMQAKRSELITPNMTVLGGRRRGIAPPAD